MTGAKVNAIVAATNSNGIGLKGDLAWSIRKDMAFFLKMTTASTEDSNKKNCCIMGRKTWYLIVINAVQGLYTEKV